MKSLKNKLLVCSIMLCVSILLLVYTTIAYFTARTEISNTLTAGNVSIELTEAAVKPDKSGNLIKDETAPRIVGRPTETVHDYGNVSPGQFIHKDPTIKNTGNQKAWIAAKVTLTDGAGDLHKIMGFDEYDGVDITTIIEGGFLNQKVHVGEWNNHQNVWYNDNFAMFQVPSRAEGTYDFYFFLSAPMEGNKSITIFDSLIIPAYWENSQLQELIDFKITVRAFAVQTTGMGTCFEAMQKAFPTYFAF